MRCAMVLDSTFKSPWDGKKSYAEIEADQNLAPVGNLPDGAKFRFADDVWRIMARVDHKRDGEAVIDVGCIGDRGGRIWLPGAAKVQLITKEEAE